MQDFDLAKKLAAQRMAQYGGQIDFQAPQGQMVSGHYVAPNVLQYLASGLRSIGGMRGQQLAQEELKGLSEQERNATAMALRQFGQNAMGAPENAPGDGMGPTQPAKRPDMMAAYGALSQAPDQGLRQMGIQGQMQTAQAQAAAQAKAQEQARIAQALQTMTPQQAIAAGIPPEMVKQFYESRNYGRDKVEWKDVGGSFQPVTEYGDTPTGIQPMSKTGNPFSDLVVAGADGQIVPNAPLVRVKESIASKGAPKTTVNLPEKKFLEGLGDTVGKQVESAFGQAQSAVGTLSNVNQIASSLDKAIVGPGANQRIGLLRIGEVLGITGKDSKEVVSATRNVMQGLARQELAAAGQMKGQGQITESERGILRRAEAGEINEFTPNELATMLNALRKTARARIQVHQANVQRLQSNPKTQDMVPYLQLEVPEDVPVGSMPRAQMPQASGVDALVEKYSTPQRKGN